MLNPTDRKTIKKRLYGKSVESLRRSMYAETDTFRRMLIAQEIGRRFGTFKERRWPTK